MDKNRTSLLHWVLIGHSADSWLSGSHFESRVNSSSSQKNSRFERGFAREFLRSCMLYRPGKSIEKRGQTSTLDSKKNFLCGGWGLSVSDVISGRLLGHLGPLGLALGANR